MRLSLVLLAVGFSLLVPSRAAAEYLVRFSGNWSYYGMSGDNGLGYDAGISRKFSDIGNWGFWYGLNGSCFPSIRIWEYEGTKYNGKFYGSVIGFYDKTQVYFLGIPLAIRYVSRESGIAPYFVFENRLDAKVFEDVSPGDPGRFHYCRNRVSQSECLERSDFKLVGGFNPLVLKSEVSLGVSLALPKAVGLVAGGIQYDATPRRQPNRSERTRTPALLFHTGLLF